ncbi:MAG: 3-dehydroquinate synthase [Acetivibrio sp.]
MSKKLVVKGPLQASNQIFLEQQVPIYPIYIENNYDKLSKSLEALHIEKCKALVITDINVGKLYIEEVTTILKKQVATVETLYIEAGESYKNLDSIRFIYETLIQKSFDRNDILFALGGGVIGDMTGYAAATFLRGIRFVQLPTSLLAMVDSSIGGKTGVDFKSYKNMVGAFYQPQAVYINLSVLATLPEREYLSGFGEIIKHGIIKDRDYYDFLNENMGKIIKRNKKLLEEVIYRSCMIKQAIVEIDPTEKADRALLNFGHTIGHAVEKFMDFSMLHGECVSLGIVASSYISYLRQYISQEDFLSILNTLENYRLPKVLTLDNKSMIQSELLSIIQHDKKMNSGQIKFILLKSIGNAYIDESITKEEISKAVSFIMGVQY